MWLERPSSSAATAHAKLATNCIASENSSLLPLAPIVLEQEQRAEHCSVQCTGLNKKKGLVRAFLGLAATRRSRNRSDKAELWRSRVLTLSHKSIL